VERQLVARQGRSNEAARDGLALRPSLVPRGLAADLVALGVRISSYKPALSGKAHCLDHHKEQGNYTYGLDHDLQQKMAAKNDPAKAGAVRIWIEAVTKRQLTNDLQASLKSGVVLCELINALYPGAVKKINQGAMPFVQRENIVAYLSACKQYANMRESDMFVTQDLFEGECRNAAASSPPLPQNRQATQVDVANLLMAPISLLLQDPHHPLPSLIAYCVAFAPVAHILFSTSFLVQVRTWPRWSTRSALSATKSPARGAALSWSSPAGRYRSPARMSASRHRRRLRSR
jgi:hypothetical protein